MQNTPEFPKESTLQVPDQPQPKLKDVKFSQMVEIWRGNLFGTPVRMIRFQEDQNSPPQLLTQIFALSKWIYMTPPDTQFVLIEAFKADTKTIRDLGTKVGLRDLMVVDADLDLNLPPIETTTRLDIPEDQEEPARHKQYGHKVSPWKSAS